jgi:hypothetical protein
MLGAQGLWAGRDLYCATPDVIRGLSLSGLIRRTAPFSCLLRHTRGCGGHILTRILTRAQWYIFIWCSKKKNRLLSRPACYVNIFMLHVEIIYLEYRNHVMKNITCILQGAECAIISFFIISSQVRHDGRRLEKTPMVILIRIGFSLHGNCL